MQGTEEKKITGKDGSGGGVVWQCRKLGRPLDQAEPRCPDPGLYCKHRPGCLVYHHSLLDD